MGKASVPAPTDEPTVFDDVDVESTPTATPTAAPTIKCPRDSRKVVFEKKKGKKIRKEKCGWIKKGKSLKAKISRCNRKYKGKRVRDLCPQTCGTHAGVGKCSFLFKK